MCGGMGVHPDDRGAALLGCNPPETGIGVSVDVVFFAVERTHQIVFQRHAQTLCRPADLTAGGLCVFIETGIAAHKEVGMRKVGEKPALHAGNRALGVLAQHCQILCRAAEIGAVLI